MFNTAHYIMQEHTIMYATPVSYQATVIAHVFEDCLRPCKMYEGVFLCGCYECVLLMPSKAFGGRRKGSTISTKRQELASLPIMTSPPQRRVRWSFLNLDGKRRRKVAGWKGKEEVRRVLPFAGIKGNS